MQATVIVPSLIPDGAAAHAIDKNLFAPLDAILTRARYSAEPAQAAESALLTTLGLAGDFPVAPYAALADGLEPGNFVWYRAAPVQMTVQHDGLVLLPITGNDLSADECKELCAAANQLIAPDGDHLVWTSAHRWYLQSKAHTAASTTPLADCIGRSVFERLPADPHLKRLMSELQMLFFRHPVNQRREAAGLPLANGLWFWGGGALSDRPAIRHHMFSEDPFAYGLALAAGRTPNLIAPALLPPDAPSVVYLPQLQLAHPAFEDQYRGVWHRLAVTVGEIARQLESGTLAQLDILSPGATRTHRFTLKRGSRWLFWRRAPSISSLIQGETEMQRL